MTSSFVLCLSLPELVGEAVASVFSSRFAGVVLFHHRIFPPPPPPMTMDPHLLQLNSQSLSRTALNLPRSIVINQPDVTPTASTAAHTPRPAKIRRPQGAFEPSFPSSGRNILHFGVASPSASFSRRISTYFGRPGSSFNFFSTYLRERSKIDEPPNQKRCGGNDIDGLPHRLSSKMSKKRVLFLFFLLFCFVFLILFLFLLLFAVLLLLLLNRAAKYARSRFCIFRELLFISTTRRWYTSPQRVHIHRSPQRVKPCLFTRPAMRATKQFSPSTGRSRRRRRTFRNALRDQIALL